MVKAPRSKGCRVCVQRRIKCDQTRPFCQRCLRARRQCTGFDDTKFIDEGPSLRANFQGSSKPMSAGEIGSPSSSGSSSLSELNPFGVAFRASPVRLMTKKQRSLSPIAGENWYQGAFERGALVSLLAPNVIQEQMFAGFIASVRQPTLADTIPSHKVWLEAVAGRSTLSAALTWAVRAISISQLARKSSDISLLETSRRIYGRALIKLNHTLQDAEEGLSSDTLSATVLLSFYEVFNCTDRFSWIRHAGGAGRLIQLRGPDRHRSGFDSLIFRASRTPIIMEAFMKRAPCFLDEPPWRKLCWDIYHEMHVPQSLGTTDEEYFQELVRYPGYIGRAIKAVGDPRTSIIDLQYILGEGVAHQTRFRSIHDRMDEELMDSNKVPTQVTSAVDDKVFPVVYEYPDIHIASFYCCYWTVMCLLNISIIGFEAKLAGLYSVPSSPPRGDLVPLKSQSDDSNTPKLKVEVSPLWDAAKTMGDKHTRIAENAVYAREICKSVEYMSHTTFLGPSFLVFAIRMALRMFITEREKAWIIEKLRDIGRDMGLATAEVERYRDQREGGYGVEWEQNSSRRPQGSVGRRLGSPSFK